MNAGQLTNGAPDGPRRDSGTPIPDVETLLTGDNAAWDGFVAWSLPFVKAAVLRTARLRGAAAGGEEIEDIVQNVFLRLINNDCRLLRQFDAAKASLKTWLVMVARSTALTELARPRPIDVPLDEVAESRLAQPLSDSVDLAIPQGVLSRCEESIIHSHYQGGQRLEDIARNMNLSRKTVYNCKSQALAKLRHHFGKA